MDINFTSASETANWRAVNDGVMGGRSSGGPQFQDGKMIFEGVINTNGGGFSSVRSDVMPGALADYSGIKLRVKSDGRQYKLTFRTDARYRGRRLSFQAEIPVTRAGEWADVTVSFSSLKASLFGQPIRGAEFDRRKIQEIGIIIADGRDGPFRLDVDSIEACQT